MSDAPTSHHADDGEILEEWAAHHGAANSDDAASLSGLNGDDGDP